MSALTDLLGRLRPWLVLDPPQALPAGSPQTAAEADPTANGYVGSHNPKNAATEPRSGLAVDPAPLPAECCGRCRYVGGPLVFRSGERFTDASCRFNAPDLRSGGYWVFPPVSRIDRCGEFDPADETETRP